MEQVYHARLVQFITNGINAIVLPPKEQT